jgi:tripartite-type tricarboxylate transporter receptor subunit TctC
MELRTRRKAPEPRRSDPHASRTACLALASLACMLTSHAAAQGYPQKPVRMIVASSAGSNPDTIGRVVANALTQLWGQQVIVDNRAGAGGNIGGEAAARAPADGYTLLMAHTNHSINPPLYRKLTYDILRDFAPVTLVGTSPFVLVVHPSLPVKSVAELIRIAKARPGDLNYASAGIGSGTFFSAEYFKGLAAVDMVHVPYTGGGPALASVVAGETTVYFTPIATGINHIRSGRLRPLGVTARNRLPQLPDVPPIAETLSGYEMMSWAGVMAPAKTPREVIESVLAATHKVLANADVRNRIEALGFNVVTSTPDELTAYVKGEIDKYGALIRRINLPQQ